jgi:hypothetical protein
MFLQLSVHVSAICRELSSSTTLYCRNVTYSCHAFPLNNTFGCEISAFYCVILLHFLLKILNVQRCPLWLKGAPWMRQVLQNARIIQMGFIFKTIRRGEFSYYLTIRETLIVYIAFAAIIYRFYFINNIRLSKNVQTCPLPPHIPKQRHRSLATKNVSTSQSPTVHLYVLFYTFHIADIVHVNLTCKYLTFLRIDVFQIIQIYR